jgi:hypothetical protein
MDGAMWLWMQLPMAKVVLVMQERKDSANAREQISLNELASIFSKICRNWDGEVEHGCDMAGLQTTHRNFVGIGTFFAMFEQSFPLAKFTTYLKTA